MKRETECVIGKSVIMAGTVSIMLLVGCSSEKVLTERPYIPAPSDQIPTTNVAGLPPVMDSKVTPVPELPPFQEPKIETLTYKVQKGDSFWKIARMHGVSMQELAAFNNMDLKSTLKVGSVLRIPPGGAPLPPEKLATIKTTSNKSASSAKSEKEAIPADGVYTVKNGDSLWKIAKKFNTTTDKLAAINNLDTKTPLQVGQKLRISGSGPVAEKTPTTSVTEGKKAPAEKPVTLDVPTDENTTIGGLEEVINEEDMKTLNAEIPTKVTLPPAQSSSPMIEDLKGYTHDVEQGETWESIANIYGLKVADLKKANPSVSNAEPVPGTKIIIPDSF